MDRRYRLRLAIRVVAAASCLWTAPAAAQGLIAASGVVSDACVDTTQTACSSGTLYVADGTTLETQRSLPLWRGLAGAAVGRLVVDRNGIYLYAAWAQTTSGTTSRWIDVIDLRAMTTVGRYGVSGSLAAGSPDGSRLYVLTPDTLSVIDSATGAALAAIPATDPIDVAVSPLGDRLYVAQRLAQGTSIRVVDAATYLPLDTIVLADYVKEVGLTDDGGHLYALSSSRVVDIDTASRTVVGTITQFGGPTFLNHLLVRGGRLFVSGTGQSPGTGAVEGVAAIDVGTRAFVALYRLTDPDLFEVSRDGSRVWVQQFAGRALATFDTAANTFVGFLTVPGGPVTFAAIPTPPLARVVVDQPTVGAALRQPFAMSGWAADTASGPGPGVSTVHVWAFPVGGGAPTFVGADYGRPRPDVGAFLGPTFSSSGFAVTVRGLQPGAYRLVAYAFSLTTRQFSIVSEVPVTIQATAQLVVDSPSFESRLSGRFTIAGWAVDLAAPAGTGVDAVHVWAYPSSGGQPVFVGAATISDVRPDVGAFLGARFERSGFHLDVSTLAPGPYTLVAYGHSSVTGTFSAEQQVRVTVNAPEPRMWVDTPGANATVGTTFVVSGWAVEADAATGTGVDLVHVWATSPSGAATFLGAATYGRNRPDVAGWLGPQFGPSGFTLTATLPAGAYALSVYARSTATGTFRQWQAVQVTVR